MLNQLNPSKSHENHHRFRQSSLHVPPVFFHDHWRSILEDIPIFPWCHPLGAPMAYEWYKPRIQAWGATSKIIQAFHDLIFPWHVPFTYIHMTFMWYSYDIPPKKTSRVGIHMVTTIIIIIFHMTFLWNIPNIPSQNHSHKVGPPR